MTQEYAEVNKILAEKMAKKQEVTYAFVMNFSLVGQSSHMYC